MNLLFTTKACPNCPAAEKVLQEYRIQYKKIYAEDDPDSAYAFGIMQAPTLVEAESHVLHVGLSNIIRFAEEQDIPQF